MGPASPPPPPLLDWLTDLLDAPPGEDWPLSLLYYLALPPSTHRPAPLCIVYHHIPEPCPFPSVSRSSHLV